MYELFQFVRTFSLNTSKPSNYNGNVEIKQYAWREEGEKSFLALFCSNDYLLLHYNVTGHPAITKQLPWPQEEQIVAMSFDPTLSWLLIVTKSLYVIPALQLVDPSATVDQLFSVNNATVRQFDHVKDSVTCAVWWHTLDGKQVAILGTKIGEIIFVDLRNRTQRKKQIDEVYITGLSLSHDDLLMSTSLLITPQTGNQWHLPLEKRMTIQGFTPDTEASEYGYDNIDGRTIPPRSLLDPSEELSESFNAKQFIIKDLQPPLHFRPQYAKGRHFITAHSTTSKLHVLDAGTGHRELFVYRLPNDADNVILTDKLIFTTINHSRDKELIVLSNQMSEGDKKDEEGSNPVMQEFLLPEDEKLIGIEMKRFPFYFHEHQENDHMKQIRDGTIIQPSRSYNIPLKSDVLEIPVSRHTVLDGCIIITSHSLYEVRPRISPERLFLHLALMLPETGQAEHLAISIGLDLTSLSEVAAEYMLEQGCPTRAMKLYSLSKCSPTKRAGGLAQHGCIAETMSQLRQNLNYSDYNVAAFERKFMSNMLLHCFVYQLHAGKKSSGNTQTVFKEFLSNFFSFNEQLALNLLSNFKEVNLLLSLANSRGLIMDALNLLGKAEAYADIPYSSLSDLVQRGFTAHLMHSGNLLPCLSPENLANLLITRPQLAIQHCHVLKPLLTSLKPDLLMELARIYDPSKPVMKGVLKRMHRTRGRANSLTSLSSFASEAVDLSGMENRENQSETLLEFFMAVVLYINDHRRKEAKEHNSISFETLVEDPLETLEQDEENQSNTTDSFTHLAVQVRPIACGPKHAAAIRNGGLYTWGRALQGRLGHGDEHQTICPPKLVETLFNLKLTVHAVACGNEHTLALTNQGVYGWGNSKYGQVGVGKTNLYLRPMFIETLQTESIVALSCGFYHSLALTMDYQVYSWGWGVHGQLGHGDPEDRLIPWHVKSLMNTRVVKIAGAYAHSLVLSEDGQVLSFGCGYFGQLGSGLSMKSSLPQKIQSLPDPVRAIGTKYFHSIAVTVANKVYIWGCHPHNLRQLASSVRQARHSGRQISEPNSFHFPSQVDTTFVHGKIIKVACGSLHTVLVTEDGGVYIWGRNLEGQLGTGSRQDERLPKMLTSLNHQHILEADTGGEYSMVMDAEASLWLWGKNDSGQLSRPRRDPHASKSRSTLHPQSSEFMTPTVLRSLPTSDPNNQSWMALLSSLSQSCTEDDEFQEEPHEPFVSHVPNMDLLTPQPYSSAVVPVTLKVFEAELETSFALQRSVDLRDWICAAQISCFQEEYIQAFYYRLQVVIENMKHCPVEESISIVTHLIEHHIGLLLNKPVPEGIRVRELHVLCQQALEFWHKHSLPMRELEKLFSSYMSILAPWLLKVVLSTSPQNDEEATSEHSFSSLFCLQVLKLSMQPSIALSGPDVYGVFNTPDGEDMTRPNLRPKRKTRPKRSAVVQHTDVRNMTNDDGAITLSQNQLEHMKEQAKQQGGSQKFVVFSCGHSYPEHKYKEEITAFTRSLSVKSSNVPHSSLLLQQLLNRPGLKCNACPNCIKQGLQAS